MFGLSMPIGAPYFAFLATIALAASVALGHGSAFAGSCTDTSRDLPSLNQDNSRAEIKVRNENTRNNRNVRVTITEIVTLGGSESESTLVNKKVIYRNGFTDASINVRSYDKKKVRIKISDENNTDNFTLCEFSLRSGENKSHWALIDDSCTNSTSEFCSGCQITCDKSWRENKTTWKVVYTYK